MDRIYILIAAMKTQHSHKEINKIIYKNILWDEKQKTLQNKRLVNMKTEQKYPK